MLVEWEFIRTQTVVDIMPDTDHVGVGPNSGKGGVRGNRLES